MNQNTKTQTTVQQPQNFVRKFMQKTAPVAKPVLTPTPKPTAVAKPILKPTPKPVAAVAPQPISEVTPKELEIIQLILEMRYLNLRQITKRFFGIPSFVTEKEVLLTVKKLQSLELIKTKDIELNSESLFTATPKAYELVAGSNPDKKVPRAQKSIFQPRVKHDMLLNDLRIRFEELVFLNKWVSEMSLEEIPFFKRSFADLPDAVCKKRNDKGYFLELEVSMKSTKVYAERIQEYLKILATEEIKDADIEGVVFFCTDEKVRDKIRGQIPEGAKNISTLLYSSYFKTKESKHEN